MMEVNLSWDTSDPVNGSYCAHFCLSPFGWLPSHCPGHSALCLPAAANLEEHPLSLFKNADTLGASSKPLSPGAESSFLELISASQLDTIQTDRLACTKEVVGKRHLLPDEGGLLGWAASISPHTFWLAERWWVWTCNSCISSSNSWTVHVFVETCLWHCSSLLHVGWTVVDRTDTGISLSWEKKTRNSEA